MTNNHLPQTGSKSLLEKGIDLMNDPNSSKAAKAGAIGLVAIGAITVIATKTLEVMGNGK